MSVLSVVTPVSAIAYFAVSWVTAAGLMVGVRIPSRVAPSFVMMLFSIPLAVVLMAGPVLSRSGAAWQYGIDAFSIILLGLIALLGVACASSISRSTGVVSTRTSTGLVLLTCGLLATGCLCANVLV